MLRKHRLNNRSPGCSCHVDLQFAMSILQFAFVCQSDEYAPCRAAMPCPDESGIHPHVFSTVQLLMSSFEPLSFFPSGPFDQIAGLSTVVWALVLGYS